MSDDILYTDMDTLIERYAIMTTDGKLTDGAALKECTAHTTPELAAALTKHITAGRDFLTEYIDNKNVLIPCKEIGDRVQPCVKVYDDNHTPIAANHIKTTTELKAWKDKGIMIFALYPCFNNLLILDLDGADGHSNKVDGITNFKHLISTTPLNNTLKAYCANFPYNFPCYVETPHGGIHLYFNAKYITDSIKKVFDTQRLNPLNIEIKYNTQVTAAGSIRGGKQYILRGALQNAPKATFDLLDALTKAQPKPQTYTAQRETYKSYNKPYTKKSGGRAKWNATAEGVIEWAERNYSNLNPHDFVYKTAILFERAGYDKATATAYIERTRIHQTRKDTADTYTAINSIF